MFTQSYTIPLWVKKRNTDFFFLIRKYINRCPKYNELFVKLNLQQSKSENMASTGYGQGREIEPRSKQTEQHRVCIKGFLNPFKQHAASDLFYFILRQVSLCSLGWPWPRRDLPASVSQVLGLKAVTPGPTEIPFY